MHIWQTKSWGKFLLSSGQAEEIFHVGWIQVEKRRVALGQFWLFVLGLENSPNPFIKGELEQLCKTHNCLFVQIETLNYDEACNEAREEDKWKSGSYKKFITPYTAVINTTQSQEEILSGMKPKGRYNIKLAIKKWIEIFHCDNSVWDIDSFYQLVCETTTRDKFAGNTREYYTKFLQELPGAQLILAQKQGVTIAGGIFVFGEDIALYYYGASSSNPEYRKLMAPYLIQSEAITESKKRKLKLYDLLWVSHPDHKDDSLKWVTDFKKKLTKDIRFVSRGQIYIHKKVKYFLIQILRTMRK